MGSRLYVCCEITQLCLSGPFQWIGTEAPQRPLSPSLAHCHDPSVLDTSESLARSAQGSGDRKDPLQTARLTQWRSESSVIPSEWCQKQCQEHSRHKPESHSSEGTHGAHCEVSPCRFQEIKLSNLVPKERTEFANS